MSTRKLPNGSPVLEEASLKCCPCDLKPVPPRRRGDYCSIQCKLLARNFARRQARAVRP